MWSFTERYRPTLYSGLFLLLYLACALGLTGSWVARPAARGLLRFLTLLGAGLLVFVEVLLDRTVHDVMDNFKAAVQVRPEILEAHLVAGGFDYLLKTRVADMRAYREFIGSVIWTLPGVRETRTYAVMEEVKHTTLLPL